MRALLASIMSLVFLGQVSCLPSVEFECDDDNDCSGGGTCEAVGFCSQVDMACEFGRRFSEHAGNGFANQCIACPDDGILLDNNRCYAGFTGDISWDEALALCAGLSTAEFQLAQIEDIDENLLLTNRIIDGEFWIGGNDRDQENEFFWIDGTPVEVPPWAAGEPNNDNGNEDCIVFNSGTGLWRTDPCDNSHDALCERL